MKKYKAIIFDFDDTLFFTSFLQELFDKLKITRRGSEENRRLWQAVVKSTRDFGRYEGMDEVFDYIRKNRIKAVIVTDTPRTRVTPAVKHYHIPIVGSVTKFDCERKPSPTPIIKGLELLGCAPSEVLSIGNQLVDYSASHAAGVCFAACEWGKVDAEWDELAEKSDIVLHSPMEILQYI